MAHKTRCAYALSLVNLLLDSKRCEGKHVEISQERLPMQLNRAFVVLLLFVSPAFAQWHPQKSNTDANLYGLSIVNGNVVWVSGTGGRFVRTTDGGETWQTMFSLPSPIPPGVPLSLASPTVRRESQMSRHHFQCR